MSERVAEPLARATTTRERDFQRLVDRELPGAYRTASLLLGSQAEAEDATQEAMVRAWQRIGQLNDASRGGAWFGRILVNVCRDRLRRRSTAVVRWSSPDATDLISPIAERDAVERALAELTPEQRIVVILRFYLDLPLEGIADRTGVPLGTVKTRLHYGLAALRAAYEAADRLSEVS